MSVIAAHELTKLVGKASEAAAKAVAEEQGDAAAESRTIDILKMLASSQVTAAVLKETDAGKRINRLSKSSNEQIAAAAAQVVQAWKACVKKQAADSGLQSTGSLPGMSSARSQSLAAGDNGSEQQEASTSQPASQPQKQQQQKPAAGAESKPPPKTGDPKRDKVQLLRIGPADSVLCVALAYAHSAQSGQRLEQTAWPGRSIQCSMGHHLLLLLLLLVDCVQVRVLLATGLSMVPEDERSEQDPGMAAAEVETAIFQKFGSTDSDYSAKVRQPTSSLHHTQNVCRCMVALLVLLLSAHQQA